MPRYIDADALKKDLTRFYDGEATARDLIDEQPTADVQPVRHGQWLDNPIHSQLYSYICSNCRNSCDWTYRYCPNCGSKNRMDGDSDA